MRSVAAFLACLAAIGGSEDLVCQRAEGGCANNAVAVDEWHHDDEEVESMKTSLLQMPHLAHKKDLEGRKAALVEELQSIDSHLNDTADVADCCDSCEWQNYCSPYSKDCYGSRNKAYYQRCDKPVATCARYGCDEVYIRSRSCHCNSHCVKYNSCCKDYKAECTGEHLETCKGEYDVAAKEKAPCLCLFDIDRTLTSNQRALDKCPRSKKVSPFIWDSAYGGGGLTLSPLSVEGINKTFCKRCYTGVVSAGSGSNDQERSMIAESILATAKMRELVKREPRAMQWSRGYIGPSGSAHTPFVRNQPDVKKQHAVKAIQKWYDSVGVCIPNFGIHFYGDRTENMQPFSEYKGINACEISCGSRDQRIQRGMVGLCGATPEEIVEDIGIHLCADNTSA